MEDCPYRVTRNIFKRKKIHDPVFLSRFPLAGKFLNHFEFLQMEIS